MKSNAIISLVNNAFVAAAAAAESGHITTANVFSASQRRYAEKIRKSAEDKAAKKIAKAEKKVAKATKKFEKKAVKAAKKAEGAYAAPLSEADRAAAELTSLRQAIEKTGVLGSNEAAVSGTVVTDSEAPDFFAEVRTIENGSLTSSALTPPAEIKADEVEMKIFDIDETQAASGVDLDEIVEKNAEVSGAMASAMRKANAAKPAKSKK